MYKDLFVEVRAYESFKYIIMGMLSDIPRKSLPAIARVVGLDNEQGLSHFLTESPWSAEELETRRLRIILEVLQGEEIEVIIDETGIEYAVAIRSNHGEWIPPGQRVRVNKWRAFEHIASDGTVEIRYIREIILSAYILVCLHNKDFNPAVNQTPQIYQEHDWFDSGKGWKNYLNNIRLILTPAISFNLIKKWLKVFPIPHLSLGFPRLIALMNQLDPLYSLVYEWEQFSFSSA